jgi:pectinesterase
MRSILSLVAILFCVAGLAQPARQIIRVAQDGSGKYRSIQEALDDIKPNTAGAYALYISKGVYKEIVTVDATKNNIAFIGQGKKPGDVVITYDNHAGTTLPNGDTLNTWTCASVFIYGNDFIAENITFQNDAGFTAGQAVAVRVEGNRAAFINCRMTGFQDVLFLSGSGVKHYFQDCYIEGTTDFIFGAATAVFKNCQIHSKKNSHVTAASTNSIIPFGFVFFDCKLTADSSINKVSLGRPWSPTASVTYINCWMGKHIIPDGWNNWRNPANEATARYAEYQSSGPGGSGDKRVKWAKQLTDEEAKEYTMTKILGNWNPPTTTYLVPKHNK